jgi:hypothetical protein
MSPLQASEDGVVECAPTLNTPEVFEEPTVEICRDGPSADTIRPRPEQNVPSNPTMLRAEFINKTDSPPPSGLANLSQKVQFAGNVTSLDSSRVVVGNVYNYNSGGSLFDDLTLQSGRFADQQLAQTTKARYRAGRVVKPVSSFVDFRFHIG